MPDLTDLFLGLPVHALVIHSVVTLVPLTALGALALVVKPVWTGGPFGLAVAALSVVATAGALAARQSGFALADWLQLGGPVGDQLATHEQWGSWAVWPVLALALCVIAFVVLSRRGVEHGGIRRMLALLTVLAAVTATAQVVITGHTGSTAVWSCTVDPSECAS